MLRATEAVTERYALGPRGGWMLNLISGGLVHPHELSNVLRIGRSLVSAELARLVATDLNPAMLEVAAARGDVANLTFAPADAQALPFADGEFDLVYSSSVVEHVPPSRRAAWLVGGTVFSFTVASLLAPVPLEERLAELVADGQALLRVHEARARRCEVDHAVPYDDGGETRADKHTYDHAHESPMVMLIPLGVLAAGAILAGFPIVERKPHAQALQRRNCL